MLSLVLLAGALLGPAAAVTYQRVACDPSTVTIYGFNATNLYGNETVTLDRYQGKVVLIYNVATYWDFTIPSYAQINELAAYYTGQDLIILGYPCNQFGKQEPGETADEIMNGIRYVRPGGGFTPMLTEIFEKVDVNGADEIPIYTYLKDTCSLTFTEFSTNLFYDPKRVGDIYDNFEKFLIGRDGKPYTRYHPSAIDAVDLQPDIDLLLAQPSPFE